MVNLSRSKTFIIMKRSIYLYTFRREYILKLKGCPQIGEADLDENEN